MKEKMKTVTLNVEGISQGQWSTFLLELNLMKKAWKPYGVVVNLKANRLKSIIEKGTRNGETIIQNKRSSYRLSKNRGRKI
jgi:hypothetical protein